MFICFSFFKFSPNLVDNFIYSYCLCVSLGYAAYTSSLGDPERSDDPEGSVPWVLLRAAIVLTLLANLAPVGVWKGMAEFWRGLARGSCLWEALTAVIHCIYSAKRTVTVT